MSHRTGSASSGTGHPAPSPIRSTSGAGSVRGGMSHHSSLGTVHNNEPHSHSPAVRSRASYAPTPLPASASIHSKSGSIRSLPRTMPSSPVASVASLYTLNPGPQSSRDGHPAVNHTVASPSLIRSQSATSRASGISSQAGRQALGSTRGPPSAFSPRQSPMVYTSTLAPGSFAPGSPNGPAASIRSTVRSASLQSPSIAPRASLAPSQHTVIPPPPIIPTRQLHPSELHLARRNANDLGQLLIAIMQYVKALGNQIRESKIRKKKKKEEKKEKKKEMEGGGGSGSGSGKEEDLKSVVEDKARLERELSELAEGSVRAVSVLGHTTGNGGVGHHPEIKVNVVRVVPKAREEMFIWEKEGYAGWKVRKVSANDESTGLV